MDTISFNPGDTIRVYTKDPYDNKVHSTPFEGIVIAARGQTGHKTITVRKNASGGVSVERIFSLKSPAVEKVTVLKKGRVRRAKLYYLRTKK